MKYAFYPIYHNELQKVESRTLISNGCAMIYSLQDTKLQLTFGTIGCVLWSLEIS